MRIKVELHRDVVWFVRHQCKESEANAFYTELHELRADPVTLIERSEALHDPKLSRYMLRFFRFAGCLAIFETNRSRTRIRVRQCRRIAPPTKRHQRGGDDP